MATLYNPHGFEYELLRLFFIYLLNVFFTLDHVLCIVSLTITLHGAPWVSLSTLDGGQKNEKKSCLRSMLRGRSWLCGLVGTAQLNTTVKAVCFCCKLCNVGCISTFHPHPWTKDRADRASFPVPFSPEEPVPVRKTWKCWVLRPRRASLFFPSPMCITWISPVRHPFISMGKHLLYINASAKCS